MVGITGLAEPGLGWTFNEWWGQAASLEQFTRWHTGLTQLATADGSFLVSTAYIEPAFPKLFPARPMLGRALTRSDFDADARVPIVINESLWEARFHRAASVIGSSATLSDVPVVIVGVLPTSSAYRHDVQVWVPRPATAPFTVVRSQADGTQARLVDGATLDDARRDIQALGARLNAEHGAKTGLTYFGTFRLLPVSEQHARPVRVSVLALLTGSSALLILAMANAATLLLNLVVDRRQELAVRAGLGATRGRLVAQLALESALIGCVSGVVAGATGAALLVASRPILAPLSPHFGVDAVRLVLQAGVALGTLLGLLMGLAPLVLARAWRDWSLLQHRGGDRGSRRGRRLRTGFVLVQVTSAMMLVTVAGAAVHAFLISNQTAIGFDPQRVLAVRLLVPAGGAIRDTIDSIVQHGRTAGLIDAAAGVDRLPIVDTGGMQYIGPRNVVPARVLSVGPDFMRAMGIPVLAGREFASDDHASAVISESLARRFWPDGSALGQMLRVTSTDRREVIGIVRDIQEDVNAAALWGPGTGGSMLYSLSPDRSSADADRPATRSLVMRCASACDDVVPQMRSIIAASGATVVDIESLQSAFDQKVAPSRVRSAIAVASGAFGLLLALTAVYGVVRHVVVARTQEMTIRMALGATPSQARAVVIRYGVFIIVTGALVGAGLARLALAAAGSLLYGVSPGDPVTYLAASLTLAAGGVLACAGPARRMGRLDSRRLVND